MTIVLWRVREDVAVTVADVLVRKDEITEKYNVCLVMMNCMQ